MTVATLADLKAHLDITGDVDEAELQNILDAAIEVVEGAVGPVQGTAVTEIHYGDGSAVIMLRHPPVAAITSVAYRVGVTDTPLTVDRYVLDSATGLLRLVDGTRFFGTYAVTYTPGWLMVPAAVRLAALIIADQLYESQRMPGSGRFGARGGEPTVPTGFAVPNRAKELLAPYRGPAIA